MNVLRTSGRRSKPSHPAGPSVALALVLTVLPPPTARAQDPAQEVETRMGVETCTFRARVVDAEGRPVAGARVGAVSLTTELGPREASGMGETDKEGRIELRLPADLYRWAVASDRHPTTAEQIVDLRETCTAGELQPLELATGVTFRGRVEGPDGEPVAGAEAKVVWDPRTPSYLTRVQRGVYEPHRQASSDAEGSFSLSGLEPGVEVEVFVHHPGFHPARRTVTPSRPDNDAGGVAGSASPEPTVFRLEAAARLQVQVVNPDDRPIEGATVETWVLGEATVAGGMRIQRGTDALGRHEEGGLKPGEVRIVVSAAGYETARRVVDLAAGETRKERFELEPVPSATVDVSVVSEQGDPVEGAPVGLSSVPGSSSGPAAPPAQRNHVYLYGTSDAEGGVSWPRVPLGSYRLSVQRPSDYVAERPEPIQVEVPKEGLEREVVLRRPPGRAVEGRVLDEGGNGVPGGTLQVFAGASVEVRTDGEGGFRFEHLPFGEHVVHLDVPGAVGSPARTARVEATPEDWIFRIERGVEVIGRLHLPPGFEPTGPWEITATRPQPTLAGSARGWIEGPEDGEPSFRFPPLASGVWTLTAKNGRALGNAEVELEHGRSETPVRQDIAVRPPPEGFPVTGTLLHRGRALAGARVSLGPARGSGDPSATRTDAQGRFTLEDVPAARYRLNVVWGGAPVLRRTVEVRGPTDLSRELRFARVRGRVDVKGVDPSTLSVRLTPRGPEDPAAGWSYVTHSYPEGAQPRSDGTFDVGPLEEGRWLFRLEVPGHAPLEREVLIDGADVEDLVLAPEPTAGLVLRVVTARGQIPDFVSLRFRSLTDDHPTGGAEGATGGHRTSRYQPGDLVKYFTDAGPTLHWDSAPQGRGLLWVKTRYVETGPLPVEIPGPELRVELPPRGKILVRAPHLTAAERQGAVVTVHPLGAAESAGRSRPFGPGEGALRTVVPGTWEVEVETEDGRVWTDVVEVRDHETTEVVLD